MTTIMILFSLFFSFSLLYLFPHYYLCCHLSFFACNTYMYIGYRSVEFFLSCFLFPHFRHNASISLSLFLFSIIIIIIIIKLVNVNYMLYILPILFKNIENNMTSINEINSTVVIVCNTIFTICFLLRVCVFERAFFLL